MLEKLFPLLHCIDEHSYWPQIEIGPPSLHLTKTEMPIAFPSSLIKEYVLHKLVSQSDCMLSFQWLKRYIIC